GPAGRPPVVHRPVGPARAGPAPDPAAGGGEPPGGGGRSAPGPGDFPPATPRGPDSPGGRPCPGRGSGSARRARRPAPALAGRRGSPDRAAPRPLAPEGSRGPAGGDAG